MACLYSNENFPRPAVDELRALGHDVTTIQERGHGGEGVADPEVLRLASVEGRAVLTLNRRDYLRLHRQSAAHSGIVVCTVDSDFSNQARQVHQALLEAGDLTGLLIRVYRGG